MIDNRLKLIKKLSMIGITRSLYILSINLMFHQLFCRQPSQLQMLNFGLWNADFASQVVYKPWVPSATSSTTAIYSQLLNSDDQLLPMQRLTSLARLSINLEFHQQLHGQLLHIYSFWIQMTSCYLCKGWLR